jgi:hypothetical protein
MGEARIDSYRDLRVWQEAMGIASECYVLTKAFPEDEVYGMTAQIRRAAVSVAANMPRATVAGVVPAILAYFAGVIERAGDAFAFGGTGSHYRAFLGGADSESMRIAGQDVAPIDQIFAG